MERAMFPQAVVKELREILYSISLAEIYDPAGRTVERREEPFTGEWKLRSLEFDPCLGPARVVCRLYSGSKEVTATIDASDFPDLRKDQRSRSRIWNNSKYHDLAVLLSVLIQEQILTWTPSELSADEVRICLPEDRDKSGRG